MTGTCGRCGASIMLRQVGTGGTYRWFAKAGKGWSWHCGNDPRHPTRAHEPAATVDAVVP